MNSIEFSANVVKPNPDKSVSAAYAIGMLAVCIVIIIASTISLLVAGFVLLPLILAAVLFYETKKRRVGLDVISNDSLVITTEQISFEEKIYDINTIKYPDFYIEGYAGMVIDYDEDDNPLLSTGMKNYLKFRFNKEDIRCTFMLDNRDHLLSLVPLFEELYTKKASFMELNSGYAQMKLLKLLSEEEKMRLSRYERF